MKFLSGWLCLTLYTILLCACGAPPEVVQGTVVSYDRTTGILVISDELTPGSNMELSAKDAEVGAELQAGDVVRIAYNRQGKTLKASRIMNITRQTELKKSGSAH